MKIESPFNYSVRLNLPNGKEILYLNRYEICQGCPQVGKLSIDGNIIKKEVFGGPLLYENVFIYIPCFKRKWFNSGFYLTRINTSTLEVSIISEMFQIIDLIKIENSIIYFYDSLQLLLFKSEYIKNFSNGYKIHSFITFQLIYYLID